MIFKDMPVADSQGALLAHGITAGNRRFKKGHLLGPDDIKALTDAGVKTVAAVQLEDSDIDENSAADQLATLLLTPELSKSNAFTGRCNLIAQSDGLFCYEEDQVHALNLLDESITLAALPRFSRVSKGQMVATVKIIPFAVPAALLDECTAKLRTAPLFTLHSFKPIQVQLIETELSNPNEKTSKKLRSVTEARIRSVGGSLVQHHHCHHSVEALQSALPALSEQADLILISGASATTDRRDVIPAAVVAAGGVVDHFGMPVDPGNLLVLGHHGSTPIIGLPGCAKSPKLNGFDWVLERLACGLQVSASDIMRMGAGGLLKEIGSRPQPRSHATPKDDDSGSPNIAAIVLAAGKSSRMQGANKLLADIGGEPMITHTMQQVMASAAKPVIVVTGRDSDRVGDAIEGTGASTTHNPDFATGMASSLRAGVNALPDDVDGALICLGDMPLVTAEQMNSLIEAFDAVEGRGICVPTYQGKWGNPVLWSSTYFDEIRAITGDKGARDLLHHHGDHVYEVSMEDGTILQDFDTPESLDALKS
jgi:molybdenum cofactor cytidylyltransferase